LISAHINHIRNIAGVESVGIGADYDGIEEYVFIYILFFIRI
jgi:microsomal dipeptidase-like Zn-dependent dipeptidase